MTMEVDMIDYVYSYCSNYRYIDRYDSDNEDRIIIMKELISIPDNLNRKEVMTMMYNKYIIDELTSAKLSRFKNQSYVVMVDFLNYYYDRKMGSSETMKSTKISRYLQDMFEELRDNHIWVNKVIFVVDWGRNEVRVQTLRTIIALYVYKE